MGNYSVKKFITSLKKYIISIVSIVFSVVNITLSIVFYFINFKSIKAGYLILQFQLLFLMLFILLKFHLGNLKIIHIKYFVILPVKRFSLLFNSFLLLLNDLRFILIISSFLLADYIIFFDLVNNFFIFIVCFIINIFYYVLLSFVIFNINNIQKGLESLSILMSISIISYNIPLISKIYTFPLYSPLSAIAFLPVFSNNVSNYAFVILLILLGLSLFNYVTLKKYLLK